MGAQVMVTFAALLAIYMALAILDYQGGFDNFIGIALFQPVMGALISVITIAICIVIGLPLRLSDQIHEWWSARMWLALAGVVTGTSFIIISLLPSMTSIAKQSLDGEAIESTVPHAGFALAGWFLVAFSLLHLFPPAGIRKKAEQWILHLANNVS